MFDVAGLSRLDEVVDLDPTGVGLDELAALTTRLGVAADRLHARLILAAVEVERRNAFASEPFAASTRDYLERRTVMRRPQATRDAALARDLVSLDAIRAALADGRLTVEDARLLCRPMRNPRLRRTYHQHEAQVLADFAGVPRLLWDRLMAMVIDRLDTDGPTPADTKAVHGHLDRHLDGSWHLDAHLDTVGGAELSAVVFSIVRQLRHDASGEGVDAPSTSTLIAEALLEMARRAAGHGATSRNLLAVNVIVSEETVAACVEGDDTADVPAATLDGMPLTRVQLRRVLCEGILHGLVVDSGGAILRLGRTSREPNAQQRLVLALRDQGCTFPGCTKPPALCHAHHIDWWSNGGGTDIDTMALVCHRHHALVHAGLWNLERVDGTVVWTHLRTGRTATREPPDVTLERARRQLAQSTPNTATFRYTLAT